MGLDGRIGRKFLHPGPGYGGSCFPKDTLALARTAQTAGAPLRLVEATIEVNEARKRSLAQRVVTACGGDVAGRTIAVLGVTLKPETDDMRDAASLVMIPALVEAGASIRVFDPVGAARAKQELPGSVHFATGARDAVRGSDTLVVLTEWNEFRALAP